MHNKTFQIIVMFGLILSICIPSSLGLLKKRQSIDGTVGIAAWNVSLNQNGISNSMQLTANGANDSYTLNVVSNSEVDVVYSIVVSNIPSGVDVKLDSGNYQTPSNNTVTFTDAGTIAYNALSNENTHTLTFRANNGATIVNNQSVSVDVIFKQDV